MRGPYARFTYEARRQAGFASLHVPSRGDRFVAMHGRDEPPRLTGAAAVILDDEGRVLLVKENYDRRRYSLPGGAVEDGESPEDAVVRETYEEAGVRVSIDYLIGEYELDNGFTVKAFRCTIVEGTPSMQMANEIAEVTWHTADELPHPRSNVLHYAVPDALLGRRDVVRRNLPRVS